MRLPSIDISGQNLVLGKPQTFRKLGRPQSKLQHYGASSGSAHSCRRAVPSLGRGRDISLEQRPRRVPCSLCRKNNQKDVADLGEGLLLGASDTAECPYFLERLGVTHVLRIIPRSCFWLPQEYLAYKYMTVDVWDEPADAEKLTAAWEDAFAFISQGKRDQGKVFVHCVAGVSRSPTICLAYLMQERGMSLEDAERLVRKVRPQICPNEGFEEQLRKLEQRLRKSRKVVSKSLVDLNDV